MNRLYGSDVNTSRILVNFTRNYCNWVREFTVLASCCLLNHLSLTTGRRHRPSRNWSFRFARAVVFDLASCLPNLLNIQIGRQRQGALAKQLHQKANIPEGPCGLVEVETFEASIPNYQIVVLSAEHFNTIIYEGPKRDKQIYLYHHNNHFSLPWEKLLVLGMQKRFQQQRAPLL